ncbi:MAG: AAA-like domain-containing protein [Eubacteriales bacterium]|nr:AAA-like domain-containing protein [Eubacteriales bacterium]
MPKVFNTTGLCVPEEHYMVNIDERLREIRKLVDNGKYFIINRARQYGKTTTLMALDHYLQTDYYVVFMDFQTFGSADFKTEHIFTSAFANTFLKLFKRANPSMTNELQEAVNLLGRKLSDKNEAFTLRPLFEDLTDICAACDKPIVLMIDEVDSAANNQVFIDFLAQLRAQYLKRFQQPAFKSVILAGVYDIKNLRQKLRPEDEHKYNSPWNIAADFDIDMSFSKNGIAEMLAEYENDYHTGMSTDEMAGLIFDHTSGYPFLVSRLCQLMDEKVARETDSKKAAWTKDGFHRALRMLLSEKNTLFESLIGKLHDYPQLHRMLRTILFTGKTFLYTADGNVIDMATMFGFIKNQNGNVAVANRIFETRLYNFYLSEDEMQETDIYKASLQDRNQFVVDGCLNMRRVLERFVVHFNDIYGGRDDGFLEEEGRQFFLLYLRPIINGAGNYYVESRTRDLRRADVVVDYNGERYIIEMKIWHGQEYNRRGEQQLAGYLEDFHINTGYMLSFNFNKNKQTGVHEITIGNKKIIEAVV